MSRRRDAGEDRERLERAGDGQRARHRRVGDDRHVRRVVLRVHRRQRRRQHAVFSDGDEGPRRRQQVARQHAERGRASVHASTRPRPPGPEQPLRHGRERRPAAAGRWTSPSTPWLMSCTAQ
ncbi:MAG: hypothetical protein MZV63_18025 [Marinilabiliales bacterium]|nr:hypothetical protein [Marinilabiliales bacterium]